VLSGTPATRFDRRAAEKAVRARQKDWRTILDQQPTVRRQIVSKLLTDKIVLRPTTTDGGAAAYEVEANFTRAATPCSVAMARKLTSIKARADMRSGGAKRERLD
jgi:hypothetical protein